ncbi:MAG: ABC-F family ATP-binding cassette domain-containing protein, partial [Myxococcales bacterium]|nr:ABC-F family ATP-binding cassette domain-containing protein [Myxococcales bacterium]
FEALQQTLEREQTDRQRRYVEHLNTLAQQERHHDTVCRRRRRKKNVGRLHELRRCTSRSRLNEKRSYAQESQARAAKIREDRIDAARQWAKATRRALSVSLPLEVPVPTLGPSPGDAVVTLHDVGVVASGRRLLEGLTLSIGRERLGIVGPNGAGKTTLLRVMLGQRTPTTGTATQRLDRIGSIAQRAADWMSDQSLVSHLADRLEHPSLEAVAQGLLAHKFPLALAQRPLRSLSPGERVRAALLCLYQHVPAVELLVLDEPTDSLDFVGTAALQRALRAWPGGLVVVSHDREFLASIGIDQLLELDGRGGYHLTPGPPASE